MKKRIFVSLMCLCLLMGFTAIPSFAEEGNEAIENQTEDSTIEGDGASGKKTRNTVEVPMNNILLKTNQASRMSYTIPKGYEDQITFAVADSADEEKVTIKKGSDGIYTVTPSYGKNQAGDTLEINALYDGTEVVGSCTIYFIPYFGSGSGVQYAYEDGEKINTAASIPFAEPTVICAKWDNTALNGSGVPDLVNATVSRWEWTTTNSEALEVQPDSSDSSRATFTLCQADQKVGVYAKPWLTIGGTEYLYNYPNYSGNSGNSYFTVSKDTSKSSITCNPSSIYEGTEITLTWNIPGVDENTAVTWSCSNPDIVPLEGETGRSVTVTTQKGYITETYVGLTVTASAQVNGKTYTDSFSTLWVWKEEIKVDIKVDTLGELEQAIADGKGTIAITQTIDLPDNTILDLKGTQIFRDTDLKEALFTVSGGAATITDSVGGGSIDGNRYNAQSPLIDVGEDGILTIEKIALKNSKNSDGEGGAVSVVNGTLNCTDVTFDNNESCGSATGSNDFAGGGSIYAMNSTLNITSSTFTDNLAKFGNGGAIYADQGTVGIIKDNTITSCEASGSSSAGEGKGGGIYCRLTGKIDIMNNTVEDCYADDNGGGIAIVVEQSGSVGGLRTDITLEGNNILTCTAKNRGGGLYLINSLLASDANGQSRESNCIKLLAGKISGCKADWGAGIDYTGHGMNPLYLTNVIVRNNEAVRGAGIWACPTSETESYTTLGGAIYGNVASGESSGLNTIHASGDDVRYEGEDAQTHREDPLILQGNWYSSSSVMTVMQRALGGGLMQWYLDEQNDRYASGDSMAAEDRYTNTKTSFSLHGELAKQYQTLAEKSAKLIIENNKADSRGGGIATNSQIIIGLENHDKTISVNKVWSGNTTHPDSVEVTLVQTDADGNQVNLETVTLNNQNNWSTTFKSLPAVYLDDAGVEQNYSYSVKEKEIAGWKCTTETSDDGLTITLTNTYDPGNSDSKADSDSDGNVDQNHSRTPETGDSGKIGFWLLLSMISLAGLYFVLKKKEYR